MNYAYVQPIKPIAEIKQELRKYTRNIGHSLIAMVIGMVIVLALLITFLSFIEDLYNPILFHNSLIILPILLAITSFLLAGFGIYKMICEYKLSKSLDDLGLYYMQETNTAKKAGEMLKIALLVNIVAGGIIGLVLYIIAYHRTAETYKELNKNDLFPKQESRLVYKSFIASIIAQLIFIIPYIFYILYSVFYYNFSVTALMIFVGISSGFMVATYIAQILGFYRLSDDALLIVERKPSFYVPVQHPYLQQPVQYSPAPVQIESTPSVKYNKDTSQEERSFCPNCGNPTDDIIIYCTKCGTKLD